MGAFDKPEDSKNGLVKKVKRFDSSGYFIPSAKHLKAGGKIKAILVGGGGGGGGNFYDTDRMDGQYCGGAGGGGGEVCEYEFSITSKLIITVGAGGDGGNPSGRGKDGGSTGLNVVDNILQLRASGGNGGITGCVGTNPYTNPSYGGGYGSTPYPQFVTVYASGYVGPQGGYQSQLTGNNAQDTYAISPKTLRRAGMPGFLCQPNVYVGSPGGLPGKGMYGGSAGDVSNNVTGRPGYLGGGGSGAGIAYSADYGGRGGDGYAILEWWE